MNSDDAKNYLKEILPDYKVDVDINYKGQPNNRYVFTYNGVDAAVLFSQKLKITKDMLDSVASAVKKKFSTPKVAKLITDDKPLETTEESKEPVATTESINSPPIQSIDTPQAPKSSDVSYSFYLAAKHVVETYERENPMS